jgi:hypothetical protein
MAADEKVMKFTKQRIWILICLAAIVPAGFLIWRYYRGSAENWVWYYIPDIIYVMLWCLVFYFIWPSKTNIIRIPLIVLVITCALEVLQLWQPDFMQKSRSTLIGAAFLGREFCRQQFIYYILGTALSIFFLAITADKKRKA